MLHFEITFYRATLCYCAIKLCPTVRPSVCYVMTRVGYYAPPLYGALSDTVIPPVCLSLRLSVPVKDAQLP